jgi:hypothetical protein
MKSDVTIEESRHFLQEFYSIPGIDEEIEAAQYCVLIEDIKTDMLARKLLASIKELRKSDKIFFSRLLHRNLPSVIKNLVQYLTTQKKEFINFRFLCWEISLISRIYLDDVTLPSQNIQKIFQDDFLAALEEKIYSSLQKYKMHNNAKNLQIQPQIIQYIALYSEKSSQKYKKMITPYIPQIYFKIIILLLIFCLVLYYFNKPPSFSWVFSFVVMLAPGYEFYQKLKIHNGLTDDYEKLNVAEKYSLQDVRFFEFKDNPIEGEGSAALFIAPKWNSKSPDPKSLDDLQDEKKFLPEEDKNFSCRGARSPKPWYLTMKNVFTMDKKNQSPAKISWRSDHLGLKGDITVIPEEKIFPLQGKFIHKHYYGFFNEDKLSSLEKTHRENYLTILKKGNIVGPKGKSGVKKLGRPILISSPHQEGILYQWSIKIIPQPDRLLGTECDTTQIDKEGKECVLINFCRHYNMH